MLENINKKNQMDETTQEDEGGSKKFLYSSPSANAKGKNGHTDSNEGDPWSFPPKPTNDSPRSKGMKLDLDDVWSIRKVGLGPSARSVLSEASTIKSEVLTKNASTAFYSRHGGMKGRASPHGNVQNGGSSDANGGAGSNWSSSGHGFAQGNQRPGATGLAPFQSPTEKAFRGGRNSRNRRFQNPSPFDNDF